MGLFFLQVEDWHDKGVMTVEKKNSKECVVLVGSGEYHFTSRLEY